MILTKTELIGSLHKEVRILLHLASKIDRTMLDYRPTPKQRSTLELLKYLSMMGPLVLDIAFGETGKFDPAAWGAADQAAQARDFDQTIAAIQALPDTYARRIERVADADFRVEIDGFGSRMSRGAFLVNSLVCSHAAYRTQLFLYLKACGRDELGTMNLWAGQDAPAPAAATV